MQSLAEQLISFVLVMFLGLILGLIFDIYRLLRWVYKPKKIGTAFGDAMFWFVVTGISYFFLLKSIWGDVRVYVFLGLILGIIIYMYFFSKWVCLGLRKFFSFLCTIVKRIIKFITKPILLFIRILLFPVELFTMFFLLIFTGFKRITKLILNSFTRPKRIFLEKKKELFGGRRK